MFVSNFSSRPEREYRCKDEDRSKDDIVCPREACSWRSDSTWCYPGTCTEEYTSNCVCSSGFTERLCQTMKSRPSILYNHLKLTADNDVEAPADVNNGPPQNRTWSNIASPSSVHYKFTTNTPRVPPPHPFIEHFEVGIVNASAKFRLLRETKTIKAKTSGCGRPSRDNPDTDVYTCEGRKSGEEVFPSQLPFQHRDIIQFSYLASNGGYVDVRNNETDTLARHYYSGATQNQTFTVTIDLMAPSHCTGSTACVGSMLTAPNVITTPTVNLRWNGWTDADSGIDYFVRDVYELHAVSDVLTERTDVVNSRTFNISTSSENYTLPGNGVYAVVLTVHDKAGNHRSARRILMYDGTSNVTAEEDVDMQLRVTTATSSGWQTTSSAVTVDWTNRYVNKNHHLNLWLNQVANVSDIKHSYDDNEGDRTVAAIDNVQGITHILTFYEIDHNGGSTVTSVPSDDLFVSQGLSQSQTITPSLVDGDTVRFWIRAYDIKSDLKEENVTVHIDTSPPVIENLWLTRGDRLNISVHGAKNLTDVTIEWVAYDEHSGVETVSWRIVDRNQDIVHGIGHIRAQGEDWTIEECNTMYENIARGPSCYCTPSTGCYHRHFQVQTAMVVSNSSSHGGIFDDRDMGVHDSDYHLEVTVTNWANLTSKMDLKVTIDVSPPHPGAVHDGRSGNPEVDYQDSLQLHAHWDGFFDRESGVKFYQYIFGFHCHTADAFDLDAPSQKVTETYSTSASWTAPSVGKYHVTVVAYNRALEASDPVCSDGVTVDTTPPSVSEVAVRDSRVVEGLVKSSDNDVWFIDAHRRRTLLVTPDNSCSSRATPVDNESLFLFPIHRHNNGSGMQMHNDECGSLVALSVTFIKSLCVYKEHHLFVNWTGSDTESGIYDYELGLMSDPSGEESPDILPYTSTHHHPQYQGYHPRLSEGQQFYIAVKAINNAGASASKVVGPVTVHTFYPGFSGSISVMLKSNVLVARWNKAFTDPELLYLKYEVSVKGQSTLIPFTALQSGGGCTLTSPPTCTAVALTDLHWDLHHSHTYFVSVRVTNIVGLSTVAVSEPYVHDVMLPLRGVVEDIIPVGEESLFETSSIEDTDQQISTSSIRARWYGFDGGLETVTYKVGIGSQPRSSDFQNLMDVGNVLQHEFTGLHLDENQKYFVTVVAATGGGEMTVSSDGVTIIRPDVDVTDVTVRDGPGCGDSGTRMNYLSPNQPDCTRDLEFQISTSTYAAHWNRSTSSSLNYPEVHWGFQILLPKSADIWNTWRDFEPLGSSERLVVGDLSLEAGRTYRAAVKFCAGKVCTKPIHSDGVTVLPHPPTAGSMSLTYDESVGGKAQIQVTMSRFRDPDIPVVSEAYDVMDRYEWGLTDNSHNSNMFINWQEVDAKSIVSIKEKMRFQITLPKQLDFTKCRRLAVRGHNVVGIYSTTSADVRDCNAYDPRYIEPAVVVDAVGTAKGPRIGYSISLDQNNYWEHDDADYTPYKNILSAVWPTLRHRNYTWAVVSGDQVDPSSHYKRESLMTVSDPCSMPDVIRCGHTVNEFLNVEFTHGAHLRHGKRFYVCIHADEKNTPFEKWTSQLSEVNACSDGITVDLIPPTPGTVSVEGLIDGSFQISRTDVAMKWSAFTDVEEEGHIAHLSGISYYEIALGSVPGGQDVVKFTNVGSVDHYTLHSLHLHTGNTYYASVKATDFVNMTTMAVSEGFLVDFTAPALTGQLVQLEGRYITSRVVHVCWTNVFLDEESGIKEYVVSMGTRPAYDDVSATFVTDQDCLDLDTSNNLVDGHSYYISLKAFNGAGLYTLSSSRPVVVDTTPPSTGHVFDGVQSAATPGDKDKDYITSTSEVGAYWEGFDDPHSSVATYRVKVGTCTGCGDKLEEIEFGNTKNISLQHLLLSPGVKYFTTVTACNTAGLCSSSSTSDGVILDSSPPVTGTVQDGTGDVDIQFQAVRTFLGCKWRGFYDPESGLDHYEWHVGITPGGDEILASRNAAMEEVIFHILSRDQQLPVGQMIYTTVRCFNKGGLYIETTSNGVMIENSPPVVVSPPTARVGIASVFSNTTISRTALSLHWEFQDVDSSIERQYLSLSSHQLGEIDSSNLEIPGFIREYTYTNLDLHDGSKYKVKVTACNMAGLCSSAATEDILVDSSKPKTGTFAIKTDHAAKLTRHQSGWMTWNRTSLNLAWLGFSDLHSGIDHYLVSVGSQEFGTDYNKGSVLTKVSHDSSGVANGDEGVLQTFNVPTETLPPEGTVFVSVWAVNGVGLQSDAYHAELVLEADSSLWLVRRCQAYNCEGHCVCAVQGGTCTDDTCVRSTTGPNTITVVDTIDLLLATGAADVDISPFNTFMAATWSVTTPGLQATRYEYSIGESDEEEPGGVFNTLTGRVWFDAGQQASAIISLEAGKSLTPGMKYSFFVKAWYNNGTFNIFKSDGVTFDTRPPTVTKKLGRIIKELRGLNESKDTDFQTQNNTLVVKWTGHFLPGLSSIHRYRVYISTQRGGHSIHASGDLTTTSYTATGLSLHPNTVYYSSVLAYNKAGLVSWAYSDGVQVDVVPPVTGRVNDGPDINDKDYHSSIFEVSSSWYGFSDTDSTIVKYLWCVGTANDTTDCSVMDWLDTGLHTSFSRSLPAPLSIDTRVWNKVYAVDAVGHASDVAVSDGVVIDTSPPEPKAMAYLGDNLVKNPSFEVDDIAGRTTRCNLVIPTSWETDTASCIKVLAPESPLAKDGHMFVSISGRIHQRISGLETGRQYKLTLHAGFPETVSNNHRSVDAIVTIGSEVFSFTLDPNLCRGTCSVGDHSVVLWNKHTYRFTAVDTSAVLKIASSSRMMEFVLDHVCVQTVDYVAGPDSVDTEEHLVVHSVFLSHWSSLQASWHFVDQQSPITQYKWAIGTVPGGSQLQKYTNVDRQTQGVISGLKLTHNSTVYITVMATNAAGLTSVSNGQPIVVDLTPPKFSYISDGLGSDEDHQTSSVVSVNWKVADEESSVDHCDWAIGGSKGSDDIMTFRKVPSGQSTATMNINDVFNTSSITVYTTVRCFNKAGLVVAATTDGVEIVREKSKISLQEFGVLSGTQSESIYSDRGMCHQDRYRVRLHWSQADRQLRSTVVSIEGEGRTYQGDIPNDLDFRYATLTDVHLKIGTSYNVCVVPVDIFGTTGERTTSYFTVPDQPPIVSDSGRISLTQNNTNLLVSWRNMFISPWNGLDYEVHVGTLPGGADIVDRTLTKEEEIVMKLSSRQVESIYVMITAIDVCGAYTHRSQRFKVNQD
ncbi:uncharacterized protein [Haliotis cracherodii]|uniref:uncharacterized protein n=1 Tax=Haliotis cracherodii TaxID=6455 RepID=UPI0039EB4DAB